jgi:uncharacterized membrane protein
MSENRGLPRLERGKDLSRIFAFSDGVFAIAITLLVLQIEVPGGVTSDSTLWSALKDEAPDMLAFVISFWVIGMYWVQSHRFMRTVDEYDSGLMLITLFYLATVVLVPFTSQLMGEYSSKAPLSMIIYTLNLVAVGICSVFMQRHVLNAKLGKPEYAWDTRLGVKSTLFTIGLLTASIPFAYLLGPWTPLIWFLLRFDPYERQRDRIYETGTIPKQSGGGSPPADETA